jgi:hypothetical protein
MVAPAVLAAYALTLDLFDTTTVRARTTQQITAPPTAAPAAKNVIFGADLVTAPTAQLHMRDRLWDYRLSYAPTLTASDVELSFDPQLLHTGTAGIAWHARSWTLSTTAAVSYGRLNSSLLYPQVYQQTSMPTQSTNVATVPVPQQTIEFGSVNSDGTIGLRVDRHVAIGISGGYTLSGGLNTQSRTVLPEQYGPHGTSSFRYQLSRRDALVTTATALEIETSGACAPIPGAAAPPPGSYCYGQAYVIQAQEGLTRQFSPTATMTLNAGLARSSSRAQGLDEKVTAVTAAASLAYRFGERGLSHLTFSAQIGPDVDVRTGLANERVQVTALLSGRITPFVTINATAGGMQTLPTDAPYAATVIFGSLGADFRFSRELLFTIGEQWLWQDQAGYGTLVSTYGFVALTVRAHTQRF